MDADGVVNSLDQCPNTHLLVNLLMRTVVHNLNSMMTGDGVSNADDSCENTDPSGSSRLC